MPLHRLVGVAVGATGVGGRGVTVGRAGEGVAADNAGPAVGGASIGVGTMDAGVGDAVGPMVGVPVRPADTGAVAGAFNADVLCAAAVPLSEAVERPRAKARNPRAPKSNATAAPAVTLQRFECIALPPRWHCSATAEVQHDCYPGVCIEMADSAPRCSGVLPCQRERGSCRVQLFVSERCRRCPGDGAFTMCG